MSSPHPTTKLKLVIVVASFERNDSVAEDLKTLGVTGYTTFKVDGKGSHGNRTAGVLLGSSHRLELLVHEEKAHKILQLIADKYGDDAVIAYSMDVEAVPRSSFA